MGVATQDGVVIRAGVDAGFNGLYNHKNGRNGETRRERLVKFWNYHIA